jgi:hypothetical protein
MSRRTLTLLVLTATIVALGASASVARGDGPIINLGDLCAGAPPHATISATGAVTTATSNGNSYFYSPQGLCYRYVVGVGAALNTQYTVTIAPTIQPDTPGLCAGLKGDVAVYSKGLFQSSYTKTHYGHLHGVWEPAGELLGGAYCSLVQDSGTPAFSSDAYQTSVSRTMTSVLGTSTRVVVGLKLNDWETLTVSAAPYVPSTPK